VLTLQGVPLQVLRAQGGLRGLAWSPQSGLVAAAGFDDGRVLLLRGNAEKLRRLSRKRGFGAGMRARGGRSVDSTTATWRQWLNNAQTSKLK